MRPSQSEQTSKRRGEADLNSRGPTPSAFSAITVTAAAPVLGIYVVVVAADQVLKAWATTRLTGVATDSPHFVGGWLSLTYVTNTGAAFGILAGSGSLFLLVPILACAAALVYWRALARQPLPLRAAVGLVAGGATGNLIDRVRLGYVIDYVHIRYWPVFNLADTSIVLGVGTLVLLYVASLRKERGTRP